MRLQINEPSTWNVLVVDDDDSNRTVLSYVLTFHDAAVVEVASGRAALDHLNRPQSFNLILLDVQMPDVNGWAVLKAIREHAQPALRKLPVIAVTAMAMRGDRERCLEAGFTGYLVKPLDPALIVPNISQILAGLE